MQHRVVITDFITDQLATEWEILRDLAVVEACNAHHEKELVGRVEQAEALMVYHNIALTAETINRLQNCQLIVRCGVGVDNIDLAAARDCQIPVANVPDYGTEEVADTAIGMALTLTRGIARLNTRLRAAQGPWMYTQAAPLRRLRGEVFGIVGLGRIGTATAQRARALGMEVVFYDPYKEDGYDKAVGVRRVERLADLLEQSYVVSLHCPRTQETHRMIDAAAIGQMQTGAYLINTARGGVVDTSVIPEAIASGKLAGVGIDVLPDEPPAEDDPLIRAWRDPSHPAHERAIINPHAAFYCEQGLHDIRVKASHACRAALLGEPPRNVVHIDE